MRIVKGLWALAVGVKDFLSLVFLLLFFGLLYGVLSAKPAPIHDGVLALKLNGPIVEQPSRPDPAMVIGSGASRREYGRGALVEALRAAATDDRVKAVALDLDRFSGGGQVALADVGAALDQVRAKGKPVVAYATGYSNASYMLAAHASEVWMDPVGAVAIRGPGGSNLYFAGLMEKLGVRANVYRVGTYKAAVEPFIRKDMSPEARENAQALAGALLETWKDNIAKARPKAKIDAMLATPAALVAASGDPAKAALDNGFVDKLAPRRAYEARLAQLGGEGDRHDPYRAIDLASYARDTADHPRSAPIGLVTVAGDIVDGKAALGTAGGDSIARTIEKALDDDSLKALVVRIDSPGGSVTASERIRQALLAAREKKIPVVVSMGNVAASGGYWVSTAGDTVLAEPATITGSIGVFGILPDFAGTMEKLGIGVDGVKTSPLSGEPDLLKGPSPEAGQMIQAGVDSIYRRFLGIVGEARHKSPADVDRIAQGRVWDGGTARQLGLIDRFGGIDDAIALAGDKAGLAADDRKVRILERPATLREELAGLLTGSDSRDEGEGADAYAAFGPAPATMLAQALAEVRAILSGPVMQVRCLECGPSAALPPAPAETMANAGWLARLIG